MPTIAAYPTEPRPLQKHIEDMILRDDIQSEKKAKYEKDMVNYEKDMVNHPSHYLTETGLETFEIIEAILGKEGAIYNCWGNVIKYISRWKKKGGLEDLKKAQWYISKMIELIERED